ncbi:unnamed protein product, partial [Vitrella brassicaformis CCMP3155]
MASLSVARESDRNALTDVRINSYGIQNTKIGGVQARARQAQDQGGPAAAAAADGDRQPPHGPQDGTSAPPDSDSKKKGRRRDTRHRQALRISYTEMLWQLHDFPYVTSSNAPPQPHPGNPQGFRSGTQAVPVEARRRVLPNALWRQFTEGQHRVINDLFVTRKPLDKVSVFGIHPPELHWIDSIEEYFKWMVLSQRPPAARRNRDDVSEDLTVTPLTDGGLQTVKFRQRYLTEAVEACRQGCGSSGVYASHAAMVGFLERLQQAVVNRHGEALVQRFVESRPKHNAKEVVIVFSAVKPDSPHKFFIHLLYRFGRFICDMDLFTVSSLCESFSRAGLLNEHPDDDSAATARDADRLLRLWARRELFNGSYTTKAFGTALERAHEYIHDVFFGRMFHVGGVPLVDMASMAWELTEQVTAAWAERRKRLAETLVGCVNISAAQRGPLVEELKRSTLRQPYLPLSAGAQPQGTGPPAWEP